MASSYPGAYPTYAAHGANMDDVPLHDDVHVQHEEDIVAIATELGLNPSGSDATVAARFTRIEAGVHADVASVSLDGSGNGAVSFGATLPSVPFVVATVGDQVNAYIRIYNSSRTTTGFSIHCVTTDTNTPITSTVVAVAYVAICI